MVRGITFKVEALNIGLYKVQGDLENREWPSIQHSQMGDISQEHLIDGRVRLLCGGEYYYTDGNRLNHNNGDVIILYHNKAGTKTLFVISDKLKSVN